MTTLTARAESTERNQRAVFAALARMTKDRTLLLECWDFFARQFRDTPVLPVNDFVGDLSDHVGLDSNQKRNVTVALFAALNRDLNDLPELPERLKNASAGDNARVTGASAQPEANEGPELAPEQAVFKAFLGDFCSRLARRDPDAAEDLADIVSEGALSGSLPSPVFAALCQWGEKGFDPVDCPSDVPTELLSEIVHQYYVAACEAVGPVATDRMIGRATETAAKLDQADFFPPDRLL